MSDDKSVIDKVKDIAGDLKLKVNNVYEKVKESDAAEKVGDVASNAKDKVVDVAGDVKGKVSGLFDKGGDATGTPTDTAATPTTPTAPADTPTGSADEAPAPPPDAGPTAEGGTGTP
jgi:hypothetical protein